MRQSFTVHCLEHKNRRIRKGVTASFCLTVNYDKFPAQNRGMRNSLKLIQKRVSVLESFFVRYSYLE